MRKFIFISTLLVSSHLYAGKHGKTCIQMGIEHLLEDYPSQTREQMEIRIKNIKSDPHKAIRSFIPRWHDIAFELREKLPVYEKLKDFRGMVLGDAHIENFGFLVDNRGRARLSMNDFDDAAHKAPLFLDLLKHAQSASYIADVNHAKLLEAYKRGLSGDPHKLSDYIKKLQKSAEKGGTNSKAKYTDTEKGPRFSNTEGTIPTTEIEQQSIQKILSEKFGNAKVHDTYKLIKESGGSAFGTRYHALTEVDGKLQLVEFKEIMDSGVSRKWLNSTQPNAERVNTAMSTVLGNEFRRYLDVTNLNGVPYQVRLKMKGVQAVVIDEVPKKQLAQVLEDELYVIGQIHRASLGGTNEGVAAYAKALDSVKKKDWEESLDVMRKNTKRVVKQITED